MSDSYVNGGDITFRAFTSRTNNTSQYSIIRLDDLISDLYPQLETCGSIAIFRDIQGSIVSYPFQESMNAADQYLDQSGGITVSEIYSPEEGFSYSLLVDFLEQKLRDPNWNSRIVVTRLVPVANLGGRGKHAIEQRYRVEGISNKNNTVMALINQMSQQTSDNLVGAGKKGNHGDDESGVGAYEPWKMY